MLFCNHSAKKSRAGERFTFIVILHKSDIYIDKYSSTKKPRKSGRTNKFKAIGANKQFESMARS